MNAEDASTRERVLSLIIERGPITSSVIAEELELTSAAVRRHIATLEVHQQIVEHDSPGPHPPRRGRPSKYYVATDAGRAELSDAYSDLATQALDFLVEVGGSRAADSFAARREAEIERRYLPVVEAAGPDLRDRAEALAATLTRDGYAATVRQIGSATVALQLCQGNCPVQEVAENYPQLCEAETRAFSRVLGVHVQRLATLAGGGHVCTTHVPLQIPVKGRAESAAGPSTTPNGVKEGSE